MFERFARSWALVKASASVLAQDKELLVFPAISSLATLAVAATFIVPLFGFGLIELEAGPSGDEFSPALMIWAFFFYLAQYFVIFFFNSALVGAALIRLEGGDPTVADGFRIAGSRIGAILGYAAIAATVGLLLQIIQERAGKLGQWVAGFLGVAWTVATFLVVPILVTRNIGPIDAVKESASLLKRTWGENLIGQGGLGLAFGLLHVLLIVAAVLAMMLAIPSKSVALIGTVAAVFVIALVLVALIQAALSGIYSAALFRHAEGHGENTGFAPQLLQAAFRPK
jgi:hypothetical protein